jgi:hypothetical protein
MADKRQMTLNLSDAEMKLLEDLAERKQLTKTGVIRLSLKLFQLVDERVAQGGKLFIEAEGKQKTELALL